MRYDVLIIFPHGIQYFDEMLEILYKYPDLELLYFRKYAPYDFIQFIEDIYKTDAVPWQHIKGKTEYLKGLGMNVWAILVKNHAPEEVMVGEGEYQHKQCMLINRFKWEVREKFNPRINGERSEHHVIHATDYESQALDLWPKLGFHGMETIDSISNPLFPHLPWFLPEFKYVTVEEQDLEKLYCYEMHETKPNYRVPIKESIYYKFVMGDESGYREYWKKLKGIKIWNDISPMKFEKLIKNFDVERVTKEPMVISEENVVVDGNHRASILLSRNINKIKVIKISWHHIWK